MRIGLIADTHVRPRFKGLPQQVADAFKGVDLILHAGDVYILEVLDWLEHIAPVLCARGNGDFALPADSRLKEAHVISVDGVRIGLLHKLPLPERAPWRTLENIMEKNFGDPVDVIVFGHIHADGIETLKGITLINPGSITISPNPLVPWLGTVAILEVSNGRSEARIIRLESGGGEKGLRPVPD